MRKILPLLALLSLPAAAADDFRWQVQVSTVSKYAPVEFVAQLRNDTKAKLPFQAAGDRPAAELILEAEGKPAVRKPLPKEAVAYKGPAEVEPSQYAWYVSGDLRHAFGRLGPGRYTLRVAAHGVVTEPAAFEVIDTSVEEARKDAAAIEGIEFRVKGKVGILRNRRKTPFAVLAYGDRKGEPLHAMVVVDQWAGPRRGWTGPRGLFCGTGLEEVTIAPGEEREIALPDFPDGILRLSVSCCEGEGDAKKPLDAVTEPFLVDTFAR